MRIAGKQEFSIRGFPAVLLFIVLALALLPSAEGATSIRLNPNTNYIDVFGMLNMTDDRIVNMSDPSDDQDAATKHYVDTQISGQGGASSGWSITGATVKLITPTNNMNATQLWVNNTIKKVGIGTYAPDATLTINGNITLLTGATINEFSTDEAMGGDSDLAVPTEQAVKAYVASQISTGGGTSSGWETETGLVNLITPSKNVNATRLWINNTIGKVGIGTYAPDATLTINGNITLLTGATINEFSTDDTMGGDSDLAVPTEQAVKAYVASQISNGGGTTSGWEITGGMVNLISPSKNVNATYLWVNNTIRKVGIGTYAPDATLTINGNLTLLTGATVNEFSTDTGLAGNSNLAVPTEAAVKGYVDAQVGASGTGWSNATGKVYLTTSTDAVNMTGMYISNSNGMVGIGTDAPTHTLNVVGNANLNNTLYVNKTTDRVGIGVANPNAKLQIIGNLNVSQNITSPKLCIGATCRTSWPSDAANSGWSDAGTQVKLVARTDNMNATYFWVNNTIGKVGIGTYTPDATLTINGNITLSTGATVNEFSTDDTLVGDSDLAVPTEAAVKGYVDAQVGASGTGWSNATGKVYLTTSTDAVNMTGMYISNSNGRVGIGTYAPASTLHVVGNVNLNNTLYVNKTTDRVGIGVANPNAKLQIIGNLNVSHNITSPKLCIGATCKTSWPSATAESGWTKVGTMVGLTTRTDYMNATTLNVNNSAGRVGIGTYTPTYKLQVVGNVNLNNTLYVNKTSDRVGLGIANPNAKLQVVGNVNLNNTLYVNKTTDFVGIKVANPYKRFEVSSGSQGITLDPDAATPTINTTAGKNLIITSATGNVIIQIG